MMTYATKIRRTESRGFTLIESLVVVGILLVLVSILVPAITIALRRANIARQQSDFQSIASALDAYKNDFGSYPTVDAQNAGAAILGKTLLGLGDAAHFYAAGPNPEDPSTGPTTYSATLTNTSPAAWAAGTTYLAGDTVLVGMAPTHPLYSQGGLTMYFVSTRSDNLGNSPTPTSFAWAQFNPFDGRDGPGFRVRLTSSSANGAPPSPNIAGGKVYGPYLPPESFKVHGMNILDLNGNPILYFPVNTKAITTNANGLLDPAGGSASAMAYINVLNNVGPFYSNSTDTQTNAIKKIAVYLGDYNANGLIDTAAGEPPAPGLNFVLWSSGADTMFGPTETISAVDFDLNRKISSNCDDITNYRP